MVAQKLLPGVFQLSAPFGDPTPLIVVQCLVARAARASESQNILTVARTGYCLRGVVVVLRENR